MKVYAIVVTYNRKELLLECVNSILKQTYKVNKIVIIDNNSTDGTETILKNNNIFQNNIVIYKKLEKNIGGSGGFYEGFKLALKNDCDYLWIMDDDTIPDRDCLKNLVNSSKKISDKWSFLASTVYGINGEFMNAPNLNLSTNEVGYPDWYKYLEEGIVKIREATFVSLLIKKEAVLRVGLPMKNYFIWGDDTEYTLRLNRYYGPGYFIGNSRVTHKRKIAKPLSIFEENNLTRINFYYYMIRNNLINQKNYYGTSKMLRFLFTWQLRSIKILFSFNCPYKFKKFSTIKKGIYSYILGVYDKNAFKNRLNVNVKYKD